MYIFINVWRNGLLWTRTSSLARLHDHRHTTLGRIPLDGRSARRRDLCMTTHNTFKRQTSMPPVGFEPTIPASEQPKTQSLDSAATGIGRIVISLSVLYRSKYVHLSLHYLSSKLLSGISGCAIGCVAESLSSSNLFCDYESQVHVKLIQVTGTCLICLELFE